MRRALVTTALALLLLTGVATAHGGYPVLDGRDGGYAVLVQASATQDGRAPHIDLTAYLTRQDLGEPDLDADVTLKVTTDEGTQTLRPKVVGDAYEVIVPGKSGAWRDWTIEATVDGAAGRAVVTADPGADYGGTPGWLIAVLVAAVLAAAIGSWLILRRRIRAQEAAA